VRPQRLSLAACGLARLDTLTRAFASKVWLKIAAVASRLQRFGGRLLWIETDADCIHRHRYTFLQGVLFTSTLPWHLMTGFAYGTSGLGILVFGLDGAVGRMSGMATRASSGIGCNSLPTRQLLVPVIGAGLFPAAPAFADNRHRLLGRIASLGHILVAFQTVCILNRKCQVGRLDGGMRIPGRRIARPQQFRLHAPPNPRPGVAVDAAGFLGRVIRSQVNCLSVCGPLEKGRFRLGMAGSAKWIVCFLTGGKGKPTSSEKNPQRHNSDQHPNDPKNLLSLCSPSRTILAKPTHPRKTTHRLRHGCWGRNHAVVIPHLLYTKTSDNILDLEKFSYSSIGRILRAETTPECTILMPQAPTPLDHPD
jgi:hypothetical protein